MRSRLIVVIAAVAVVTALAVVALLALLAPPAETPGSNEGGPGLPVQLPGDPYRGDSTFGIGELEVGAEGCFRLDLGDGPRFVIWPEGFTADGDSVLDASGTRLEPGTELSVSGLVMPYDELVAIEGADGYWANVAGFCIGDDDAVLVLDTAEPVD